MFPRLSRVRFASAAAAGVLLAGVTAVIVTGSAVGAASAGGGATGPGASNTGVPAGTVLTVHTGDINVTTPGTVIANLDLHGNITISTTNVTIKNSIIRGGAAPTHNNCVVNASKSIVKNLLIQDSEIFPTNVNPYQNSICGSNFTLLRVNSHHAVDTADVFGSNVTIQSSWLHGTVYFANDPNHGGGPSHNDAVQVLGGSNIKIIGNTLQGGNNSAVQITQDDAAVSNVSIANNYVDGGTCTLRTNDKPLSGLSGLSMTGNVFAPDQTISGCAILVTTRVAFTASNNTWTNGSAVPVRVWG